MLGFCSSLCRPRLRPSGERAQRNLSRVSHGESPCPSHMGVIGGLDKDSFAREVGRKPDGGGYKTEWRGDRGGEEIETVQRGAGLEDFAAEVAEMGCPLNMWNERVFKMWALGIDSGEGKKE